MLSIFHCASDFLAIIINSFEITCVLHTCHPGATLVQQEDAEMPRMYCHNTVSHIHIVKPEVQYIDKNERGIDLQNFAK